MRAAKPWTKPRVLASEATQWLASLAETRGFVRGFSTRVRAQIESLLRARDATRDKRAGSSQRILSGACSFQFLGVSGFLARVEKEGCFGSFGGRHSLTQALWKGICLHIFLYKLWILYWWQYSSSQLSKWVQPTEQNCANYPSAGAGLRSVSFVGAEGFPIFTYCRKQRYFNLSAY